MRHVILGTAGHIDHGKSSLVKAMTGIDPDRLKEEKERGITIDLGFAELDYGDELSVGVVDVPGHERLIKNMLAGAGGIDMVLMVIAADEGIMPQSREHLHICNLLRIKTGLVAITKSDLVEPDWIELVRGEVENFVSGTFLEGCPIIPVSSSEGTNIPELKEAIREIAERLERKPTGGLLRLPVDRVFTLKGFGTVVTGTAVSGSLSVEEQVEILPSGLKTKVRGLHSHGKSVKKIYAGQRAAVNLQSVEKDDLKRGDTVVTAGRFASTTRVDASVQLLEGDLELKSRSLVHFHLGTSESVARVVIYDDTEVIKPGGSAYCQFRLVEPVVTQAGDRFIIRRFSPLETIGGGSVLDPSPGRRRKRDGIEDLKVFESGSLQERISMKVRQATLRGMTRNEIEGFVSAEVSEVRDALGTLKGKKEVLKVEDVHIHADAFSAFERSLTAMLEDFHKANPMTRGMQKEEARVKLKASARTFSSLLEMVEGVQADKDVLFVKGFSAAVSDDEKGEIVCALEGNPFEPPSVSELAERLKKKEKQLSDVLKILGSEGMVKRLNDSLYMGTKAYDEMLKRLKMHYENNDGMTVAEFRDLLGTTRKFALPFLEHLDSSGITLRVDDTRKLLKK